MSKRLDRYWPRMTDVERANYLARMELEKNAPAPRWAVMLCGMLLLAIPLVYCAMANAGPVIVPVMSAGAIAAQRNNDSSGQADIWTEGPCKGIPRAACTPIPKKVDQK